MVRLEIKLILCMTLLSVASVNVNGLTKDLKRNVLFDYLERKKFSVIFLQETHSEPGDVSLWSTQWKGKMYFCHGNCQSLGVAILVSEKSNLDVKNIDKDGKGRWIKGEINWNNTTLSVASVYAPNEQYARSYFVDDLSDRITGDYNWIIGRDFNCNTDNSNC